MSEFDPDSVCRECHGTGSVREYNGRRWTYVTCDVCRGVGKRFFLTKPFDDAAALEAAE